MLDTLNEVGSGRRTRAHRFARWAPSGDTEAGRALERLLLRSKQSDGSRKPGVGL